MFKTIMRDLIKRIIFKLLPPTDILEALENISVDQCKDKVTIGKKSNFYKEAKVYNFRNDKLSILIGEGSHIRGELLIFANGGKITIGSNTFIGAGTRIWSAKEIIIGDNVLISHNCNIIDTDSHEIDAKERALGFQNLMKTGHPKEQKNVLISPIYIEEFAWISYNVSILKGVKIGKGSIIGGGSVVTKDVPPYTLVAGNPAVHIKNLK